MTKTWTDQDLEDFLVSLNPNYKKYAAVLSGKVTTREQLANADKEDLIACGITEALHATDIKIRAGNAGQLFAAMI